MLKKWVIALFVLIAVFAGTLLVYAGLHFGGATSFGYGSLIADVQVLDVPQSSRSVTVSINATGRNLTAWCVNPANQGTFGRNPVHINVNVSDSQTVTPVGGTAYASFELSLIPSSPRRAGCPGNNWTVTDLFGTVHVTLTAVAYNDQGKPTSTSENLDCTVDQQNRQVTCQVTSQS